MLVSVYMPTKDRLESLKRAVDSVLEQTHRDLELIVVDDGSTDGTAAYMRALCQRESRVRSIRLEQAQGAPAARNAALRAATGEFATGLDDDDCFLPHRLESFVTYWKLLTTYGERPACLYALDEHVRSPSDRRVPPKQSSVSYADLFEGNLIGNQIFAPLSHYLDAGLFDETLPLWQDLELFMRVLQKFGTARLLDMVTYLRSRESGVTRISAQSRLKVMSAFEAVASKHARGSARRRLLLMLQVFNPYYGHRPSAKDVGNFVRDGIWFGGLRRLAQSAIR